MGRLAGLGWAAFCAVLALGCGEASGVGTPLEPARAGALSRAPAVADRLDQLRTQFEVAETSDADVELSLLPRSSVDTYLATPEGFEPRFAGETSPPARIKLGSRAQDWSELSDVASSVSLRFRLADTESAAAETAEGYLMYRGAAGAPTRLLRAAPDGTEDYLFFERAPRVPQTRYELELGGEVRGLRLVANTLEALDWEGTPRLRVSPPFLMGSDGARVDASLRVEGCEVDTDPAAPWGRAPKPTGGSNCWVVVSWAGDQVAYPALLDPTWSTTGAMTIPRAQHTAVSLKQQVPPHRRMILVAGGLTTGGSVTASAELFDQATSTYAATQSMSTARHLHTATVGLITVTNESAFIVGGFTTRNATPTNTAEKYDPVTFTWASLANMLVPAPPLPPGQPATPLPRAAHAAFVTNSGLSVCGGIGGDGTTLASCGVYSLATGAWINLPVAMPTPRAYLSMAYGMSTSGSAYPIIIGGTDGTTSASQILGYAVDGFPRFDVLGTLQVPRHRHTVTRLPYAGNPPQFLIAGGISSVAGQPDVVTPSTEIYATGPRTSRRSANLITARRDHSATEVLGRILIAGGFDSAGAATSSAELFQNEVVLDAPAIPSARGYHSAVSDQPYPNTTTGVRVIVGGGTTAAAPGSGSSYSSNSQAYSHFTPAIPVIQPWTYRYPADFDPLVAPAWISGGVPVGPERTEIWGTIFAPETLQAGTQYPIIVLLHGAHNTCGRGSNPRIDDGYYLPDSSTCADGYREVQNHRGYDYLAVPLAERGFIVVSINANRAMLGGNYSDNGYILRRGRLLLRHLKMLSEWNAGGATTGTPRPAHFPNFQGRLNLGQVGIMGHSRGGEAARAALHQYREAGSVWPSHIPGLSVRSIFEIGPTDFITYQDPDPLTLNAAGTKWVALLPMCDGDSSHLEGVRAFDRMLLDPVDSPVGFKATYTVWGANHNYYNTEWQRSEQLAACVNHRQMFAPFGTPGVVGSAEQRQSGFLPMYRFFAGTVGTGADITQARIFNPAYPTPAEPRVDRGFTPSTAAAEALMLENFTGAAGTGSYGVANGSSGVTVTHGTIAEHAPNLRGGAISWASTGTGKYFQSNWAATGAGFNLSSYAHLELRIERTNTSATASSVSVQLVNSNNTLSAAVPLASYVKLTAPVGSNVSQHLMLQSARIPLSAFSSATLNAVRGVRISFATNGGDAFVIANIRATRSVAAQPLMVEQALAQPSAASSGQAGAPLGVAAMGAPLVTIGTGNEVLALRSITVAGTKLVRLELELAAGFTVRDAPLVLRIGDAQFRHYEFSSSDGRTNRLTFTLSRAAFDQLKTGDAVSVRYPEQEWVFGTLDKARLAP